MVAVWCGYVDSIDIGIVQQRIMRIIAERSAVFLGETVRFLLISADDRVQAGILYHWQGSCKFSGYAAGTDYPPA